MKQKILLMLLLVSLVFACKKEKQELNTQNELQRLKLEESKKILTERKSLNYSLQGYSSVEEAVKNFLIEVRKTNQIESAQLKSLVDQTEKEFILYPNILGYGTSLDVTPLDDYNKMIRSFEILALGKLKEKSYTESDLKSIKIMVRSVKDYGKTKFHKIGLVIIGTPKGKIEIGEIRSVIQLGNRYKVAILAP
ncbi:hypothetical protein EHQ23_01715 [Leptospira bourretii]|uniref:Lipoprotein n=3 Tax=Leptospira bourretii TaxID=2484962 RepID=A0A4R9IQ98_9LEPT|nr:hypothetical protein EHQ23_01715 [Leptospira bourretii]TGK93676.1 hypothetical protein EHQ26_06490 [Leptospira bourretii]TGL22683.1 hypothetical protein EHQ47_07925 [Leptospira bourretii]